MTTKDETTTTEAVTVPEGRPAVDQAAAAAAVVVPAPTSTPKTETPTEDRTLASFTTSAELVAFLRELRSDVDQLKAFYAEVNETQFAHADVVGEQTKAIDVLQAAVDRLVAAADAPRGPNPMVRVEAARTLPAGAALPGGIVLPPVRPAPNASDVPGVPVLPPLRAARSVGAPTIQRPATTGGLEVAIPADLPPGEHVIPASPETGNVDIVVNVKRGIGNVAAPRNPSPAFRRSR